MTDDEIHHTITRLVEEEHHLRGQSEHTEEQRAKLASLETALDQAWDLLRQRDALRDSGANPDKAASRPVSEVEGYLQ
jgi:multidrug resistance efflux pump